MSIRLPRCAGWLPAVLCLSWCVAPQTLAAEPCSRLAKVPLAMVTYAVADLVIPVNREPRRIDCGPAKVEKVAPQKSSPAATREDLLIKLIVDSIQPQSWSERGGTGTIDYFPLTMSLVVTQTPEVQDQVADLLAALRRLQDQEVAFEVRVLTIAEDLFQGIGVEFTCAPDGPKLTAGPARILEEVTPGEPGGLKALNDAQLRRLMEAVQGDRRSNVMQTPKMTLLNGQQVTCCAGDEQRFVTGFDVRLQDGQPVFTPKTETIVSGLELSLHPVISADRRSVRVDLQATLRDVDTSAPPVPVNIPIKPVGGAGNEQPVVFTQYLQQPRVKKLSVEKSFTVADGHTMVVDGGKRTRVGRNEYATPIVGDLPLVGRLFRTAGYAQQTERVLLLVTPRIIAPQEQEEQKTPAVPPKTVKSPVEETLKHFEAAYKESKTEEAEKWTRELGPDKRILAEVLVEHYQKACAEGRLREARVLATKALALDPTCFSKPR